VLIVLPIRTVSESNQHTHWLPRARRAKAQRREAYLLCRHALALAPPLPLLITLTRIAPRSLDQGNLEVSFKAVQDGIADWMAGAPGKGQDRQSGLVWAYAQRKGAPRTYAVYVEISLLEGM
jgi:hypothetical protein